MRTKNVEVCSDGGQGTRITIMIDQVELIKETKVEEATLVGDLGLMAVGKAMK
jgi:hypothetical protein